ncbi:hypothetical protein ACFOGJ_23195 [Marinibaculum pumilum]|uniref:Class I SAM-dependent methyltransferase n=1 Tax=Marinibaculum pumilum TaxID=1766165 RepID=A0ABV7L721_9PROT
MIDHLCKAVIAELGIRRFVETGLYMGETVAEVSAWFAELHPGFGVLTHYDNYQVRGGANPWNAYIPYPVFRALPNTRFSLFSIENNAHYADRSRRLFASNPNIAIVEGSSEAELKRLLAEGVIHDRDPWFFYLDAHWGEYWPLRDEIATILTLPQCIVVVDDFEVPGQPKWGFDMYQGVPCNMAVIADLLAGHDIAAYYPVRSNRDNRGWVILFKGFSEAELAFMAKLPFDHAPL